jgi:TolB-like protein/Tfp pilus assembly protein PilF
MQRIRDKIFRKFPKCGKIGSLTTKTEAEAALRLPRGRRNCAMDALASSQVFLFEDFRFDRRGGGLYRRAHDGALVPVAISSRALAILDLLIERAGEVVPKHEIIAAVWPGVVVDESNLTVQISALRRALQIRRPNGRCIQTVPGRGYRFAAPVTPAAWAPPIPSLIGAEAIVDLPATSAPLMAPRLSILVLPFTNLSNDPDQQYFADGMTEDLTTDLSRIAHMFVIACNTAFIYRNKPIAAKQIGRELGVRYLLEGSVQRLGSQVRINAQLIEAETNAHLWAERFDGDTSDLFVLQNEIITRIAVALNQELIAAEAARRTEHPDVSEYILRARAAYAKPISRERNAEGIRLLELALALDPDSAEAQSMLAGALAGRVLNGLSDARGSDLERAKRLSEQALAASFHSPWAHIAKAHLLRAQRRYSEAIPEYETALAYNRNYVYAYFALGKCKLYTGSIEETIPLVERAIRLSPRDPELGVWYKQIGHVHLLQSRMGEAVIWLQKARNHTPGHPTIRGDLASAYALNGETERAAVQLAKARRLSPDDRYSSIARLKEVRNFQMLTTQIRALSEATYYSGLRKAGMPEKRW